MNKKYKFSVIIPIYNAGQYLDDAINSVISQTIGFSNIELILVNDGSTDNSEDICMKYKEKYSNIIYVKQKNKGASSARNKGLSLATGQYVNFLDADDLWNDQTFKKVYKLKEDIIVVNKAKYIKRNKYLKKCYVNKANSFDGKTLINKNWNQALDSVNNVFIKTEIAKKYKFDEELKYYEGFDYINRIVLDVKGFTNCNYGAYLIRTKDQKNSLMDLAVDNEEYYLKTIHKNLDKLIDLSKKKNKKIIKFIQYAILNNINERIGIKANSDKVDVKKYINKIKSIIKLIDEEVFEKYLEELTANKYYLIKLKDAENKINYKDGEILFNNKCIFSLEKELFELTIFEYFNNKLFIAGKLNKVINDKDYKAYIKINDKKYDLKLFPLTQPYDVCLDMEGKLLHSQYGFEIHVDIKPGDVIEAYASYKNNKDVQLNFIHGMYSKFNNYKSSHYSYNGLLFTKDEKHIYVKKYNLLKKQALEIKYEIELLKKHQIKVFGCRMLYYFAKLFKRKDIWLVQERPDVANDNAYHMFKYIMNQKNRNYKCYFVIRKNCDDYKKMKEMGPVMVHYSVKHLIYFLLSDIIISSQANSTVVNIYGSFKEYMRDLFNFKFVFLQHGVTKDDMSLYLNKFYRNCKIFVTTAKPEHKSLLTYDYYYGEDVVKCTGFPRYDNLVDESKKLVIIMPTWRKFLTGTLNPFTRTYGVNSQFESSEFYNFYNNLINDERIINKMKEKGYKGIFGLHPFLASNHIYFKDNDVFKIERNYFDYGKMFREGSFLISDYSSVPIDFAYLKKPVLYTQFDRDYFFGHHSYVEGYYDYEKDGFGPVCKDYESAVKEIIKILDSDCKMDKMYEKRVNNFFMYNDRNNCKRVYDEIMKL